MNSEHYLFIFWGIPLLVGLIGLTFLLIAMHNLKRKRFIDDIPTCRSTGVFIGMVELKGSAEMESPLSSFLTGSTCVWYDWIVEEEWARLVTETFTDSRGRTQTRTRRETGWTRVAGGTSGDPFYLKDDFGVVRVQPVGAKIESTQVLDRIYGLADPIYYGKGPGAGILNSTQRRRFREKVIPLHADLYLLGRARERQDVVAAEIGKGEKGELFLISQRKEEKISAGYGIAVTIMFVLGVLLSAGGMVLRGYLLGSDLRSIVELSSIAGGVFLLAWILGWIWTVFNSFVGLRQRVKQAWSNVDVELKRRADLIPNLVELVGTFKKYEKETLEVVTQLRTQQNATAPGLPGPDPQGCAQYVGALAEKYPELKSSGTFLMLQKKLIETEQRIALARSYFNDIGTFYNTRLERIPDRFLAFGMKSVKLIGAEDFEKAYVKVELAA